MRTPIKARKFMKPWTRKCHPDYVVHVKNTRDEMSKCPEKQQQQQQQPRPENQIWMQRVGEGLKHKKMAIKNIDICISNQMLQGFHCDKPTSFVKLLEMIAAMAISQKLRFYFTSLKSERKKNCQLIGAAGHIIPFHACWYI